MAGLQRGISLSRPLQQKARSFWTLGRASIAVACANSVSVLAMPVVVQLHYRWDGEHQEIGIDASTAGLAEVWIIVTLAAILIGCVLGVVALIRREKPWLVPAFGIVANVVGPVAGLLVARLVQAIVPG